MTRKRNKNILNIVLSAVMAISVLLFASCGSAGEISGKYTTNDKGLAISGYEFFDDGTVTIYCAGFENSHGTYEAKGSKYVITIDDVDQESFFLSQMEEIRDYCTIKVKVIDDNTIETEIDANDSSERYLGQVGKEEYTKED